MDESTYYLDINGLSKHVGGNADTYEYNETNPGLGITRETTRDKIVKALMAGYYKNSYGDPTVYAGGHLAKRFGDDYYMDIGGSAYLLTGYPEQKLTPAAAAMVQVGKKNLGRLKLQYAPSVDDKLPHLFTVNLGIPFK